MTLWLQARRFLLQNATRLPARVNRALIATNTRPELLYGRAYRDYRAFLARTEPSYDNLPALLEVINRAIGTIPYFRDRYGGRTVRSRDEMEATIAFTDKDTILASPERFTDPQLNRTAYDSCSTGGTSGKPLTFLAPKNRFVVEFATMHSLWRRAGLTFEARAVIRNHHLDELPYVVNPLTREVIFDGFRLTDDHFAKIYRTMEEFDLRFVHCYPSTAFEFASFIHRRGLDASRIAAFLSGSETVFEYQRTLIQDQLGIRFYNWYGHSEKLVLAGFCARSNYYHVEPTYGYFELVDDEGGAVREPGQVGEIVGTSLHNPGMPFIRYRTGDRAEYVGDHCAACGRNVPVLRDIRGRWRGERIYKGDGSFVTTTALNLHDEINKVINGMQYVQNRKGELFVLVVKSERFTERHASSLRQYLTERLGEGMDVQIEYVPRLRRNPNGKLTFLLSTVDGVG